jgi:spore coat polysaccharide biosynthesis protein SpsF (cytidylyltransferase family)
MKTVLIIQGRMNSRRLPGKSLMKIGSKFLIDHVIERALVTHGIEDFYLATSDLSNDDVLAEYVSSKYPIKIFRGSPLDVRSRFIEIAKISEADLIVRITGDDPFKDPAQTTRALEYLVENNFDYVCNFEPRVIPIGMDVEVFTSNALFDSVERYRHNDDFEHVTWSLRSNAYSWDSISNVTFMPNLRLTVDYQEDLEYCSMISAKLSLEIKNFSWDFTKAAISTETEMR